MISKRKLIYALYLCTTYMIYTARLTYVSGEAIIIQYEVPLTIAYAFPSQNDTTAHLPVHAHLRDPESPPPPGA